MSLVMLGAKPALALVAPVLSYDTVTQTSVHLTWTDGGNEQGYRVYKNSVLLTTLGANVLSYTAINLTPSTTYTFQAGAKKGNTELKSNIVTVTTQSPPAPECSDGINNDPAEDSLIDFPNDPGCTSATDTTESPNPPPLVECNDGINNDPAEDSLIDYPADPGCTSATDTTESPNPPPQTCTGVDVPYSATVGYLNTVIPGNGAQTYCLSAGQYEMGTASLSFDSGDAIVGQPVTFGPNGEVAAPTLIHGTGGAIIKAQSGDITLTVDSLDVCCATGTGNANGNGISGNFEIMRNLTVRNSRVHGNASTGITGVGEGLVVENSEIDGNGTNGSGGYDAGVKTVHYAVIRGSYFHDNFNGMWWDCDAPGGEVVNSTFDTQVRAGVFVEISSGDSTSPRPLPVGGMYGFRITGNHIEGNNTSNTAPYGGIWIVSSRNVNVDGNVVINNTWQNIRAQNDTRSSNGHNGCSSGFTLANVTIQNNQYGPIELQGCEITGVLCTNNTKIL
jgi:hypothetical protein